MDERVLVRCRRTPATTAAAAPDGESSSATHCAGCRPSRRIATRYGSGSGLAAAHSSPMTRVSNHASLPMLLSINSALGRGAFVTAAVRTPVRSIHSMSRSRPGVVSLLSWLAARSRKRCSFCALKASASATDFWGNRSAQMAGFERPLILSRKKASEMGLPPSKPSSSRTSRNTSSAVWRESELS